MRARSRSVAASRSSRLRARSAGECAVAADDQPLARELGRGDAGHVAVLSGHSLDARPRVAVIKQRHLQGSAFQQCLDCRGAQGGDPVEPGRFEILADARLGDHAAVANQDDMVASLLLRG